MANQISNKCFWMMIGLLLLIAANGKAAEVNKAVAVTFLKADLREQVVLAKTTDGKQEVFRFTSQTPVTSLAEAAMNKRLHGGVGYQFIVYYVMQQGEKIATAFHYVGREEWKEFRGILMKVDPQNRSLVAKPEEGPEEIFIAGEHCTVQDEDGARSFIRWANEKSGQDAPAILRYTIIKNRKVAHLLELVVRTTRPQG